MFGRKRRRPLKIRDLQPEVKVKRLNRRAIGIVMGVGIVVLWSMLYVLSTHRPEPKKWRPEIPPASTADDPDWAKLFRQADEERQRWHEEGARRAAEQVAQRLRPGDPRGAVQDVRLLETSNQAGVVAAGFERQALGTARRAATDLQQAARDALDSIERIQQSGVSAISGFGATDTLGGVGDPRDGPPFGGTASVDQQRDAFLRRAAERRTSPRLESRAERLRRHLLVEGTLIPAVLVGGIHSELPGRVAALVRQDVFDSLGGHELLIPRGSRLVGEYDHAVVWGQRRVLVAWQRLVFPDGRSLELRGMPGADAQGRAGLGDQANSHLASTFGHALMLSAIGAGVQLGQPQESADGGAPSTRQILAGAVAQEVGRTANEVLRRQMNRAPTLEVRSGYRFNVVVTADLLIDGGVGPPDT